MKLPKDLRDKRDISRVGKQRQCMVKDCSETAVRSLAESKWSKYVERAKLRIDEIKLRKIFLCKKHYKEVEKTRKSQEKLHQKKGFLNDSHLAKKGNYFLD